MRRIYSAASLPDAHIMLHLLKHAGIEARIFNENAQGGLGEIPFTHAYPEVWLLNECDYPRAREIVKAHDSAIPDPGVVRCRRCGEDNPRNFEVCWQCGETLV
jgi:Putative prokaryotic signal transducing protein